MLYGRQWNGLSKIQKICTAFLCSLISNKKTVACISWNHTGSNFMKNIYSRYGKEEFWELCCYLNKVCRKKNIAILWWECYFKPLNKLRTLSSSLGRLVSRNWVWSPDCWWGAAMSKCLRGLDHYGGDPRLGDEVSWLWYQIPPWTYHCKIAKTFVVEAY